MSENDLLFPRSHRRRALRQERKPGEYLRTPVLRSIYSRDTGCGLVARPVTSECLGIALIWQSFAPVLLTLLRCFGQSVADLPHFDFLFVI